MSTLTFDTLKFANQLKTAGVPATHAEAEAKALSEVFEINLSELATKEDLHREIGDVRHEISDLRKDTDAQAGQPEVRASQMAHWTSCSTGWLNNRSAEVLPD
jgi:hypothetical protein